MNVIVTGGAGYIGSHVLIELHNAGHNAVVFDNYANSTPESLKRVAKIIGQEVPLENVDCCDKSALDELFTKYKPDAVIHLAGLKAVGESVEKPLWYYRNNIDSTLSLLEVMSKHNVKKLVFSSSATVYGDPSELPLKETSSTGVGITNPYGATKYMIERICSDLVISDPTWAISALRYFNPIGAHESGLIGENPNGVPANILPYISQVAVGKRDKLKVFGDDYDTPDGTGVRDYLHIVDLAKGHIAALEHLNSTGKMEPYNLSTGKGTSVLELLHAFEKASGKEIPYEIVARRPGDIASAYADASKALNELGWKTEKTIEDACADAWRWQSQNPNGFGSA